MFSFTHVLLGVRSLCRVFYLKSGREICWYKPHTRKIIRQCRAMKINAKAVDFLWKKLEEEHGKSTGFTITMKSVTGRGRRLCRWQKHLRTPEILIGAGYIWAVARRSGSIEEEDTCIIHPAGQGMAQMLETGWRAAVVPDIKEMVFKAVFLIPCLPLKF